MSVIVNRLRSTEICDSWLHQCHTSHVRILSAIEEYVAPMPVKREPLFAHES
jgi:hypothetical protein